ncbi:tryptophan--tRNA ligase [Candidatus Sumerlaeota bacterium]|nr:tryptophan--tRNA ligase [Candidatus Sumerlaeota bacterium]
MTANSGKPVLLSGSAPSGILTIGNYIGAVRNWVQMQQDYDCIFILVDLHAITVRQDPKELLQRSYQFIAQYLACGLDPEHHILFAQSHVPGHSQLAWLLNCYTQMGQLSRMTQFKDKAQNAEKANVGLFAYPTLMAADILLYDADLVPVGEDQKQHLELTRDLAQRVNNIYNAEIFKVPEPYIPKVGARIMSLQEPTKKMSKSDKAETNYIALLDEPKRIKRKIMRAVTDSGEEIKWDPEGKPGVANLMSIHSAFSGKSFAEIERAYGGQGYGGFKGDVAELVVESLAPIQKRYHEIIDDKVYLNNVLRDGAERACVRSQPALQRFHDAIGFIPAQLHG